MQMTKEQEAMRLAFEALKRFQVCEGYVRDDVDIALSSLKEAMSDHSEAKLDMVNKEPVAGDSKKWEDSIDDVAWAAINAWDAEIHGPMPGDVFNKMKHRVHAAILKYLDGYTAPPKTTWQPIATAPKDGTRILLAIDNRPYGDPVWTGLWADGWMTSRGKETKVTNWMPIPQPPKAEAGKIGERQPNKTTWQQIEPIINETISQEHAAWAKEINGAVDEMKAAVDVLARWCEHLHSPVKAGATTCHGGLCNE